MNFKAFHFLNRTSLFLGFLGMTLLSIPLVFAQSSNPYFSEREYCPYFSQTFDEHARLSTQTIIQESIRLTQATITEILDSVPNFGFPTLTRNAVRLDIVLVNEYLRNFDSLEANLIGVMRNCLMAQNRLAVENPNRLQAIADALGNRSSHSGTVGHLRHIRTLVHDLLADTIWRYFALLATSRALTAVNLPWERIHRMLPPDEAYDFLRNHNATIAGMAGFEDYRRSVGDGMRGLQRIQDILDSMLHDYLGQWSGTRLRALHLQYLGSEQPVQLLGPLYPSLNLFFAPGESPR